MESSESFSVLCSELFTLIHNNDCNFEMKIGSLLTGFNSQDFSNKICEEQVASKILCRFCHLVSLQDVQNFTDLALLIFNLVSRQELIVGSGFDLTLDYLLNGLRTHSEVNTSDAALRAIGALLYQNGHRIQKYEEVLLGDQGVLRHIITGEHDELLRSAVQCVENICMRVSGQQYLTPDCQARCMDLFIHVLQSARPARLDEAAHCKILLSTIRGVQHILVSSRSCPAYQLGKVLATMRTYMAYGVTGVAQAPTVLVLHSTPLGLPQAPEPTPPKSTAGDEKQDEPGLSSRPGAGAQTASKTPSKKQRKKRNQKDKTEKSDPANENSPSSKMAGDSSILTNPVADLSDHVSNLNMSTNVSSAGAVGFSSDDTLSLYTAWSKAGSSDSEFSDTEGTGSNRIRSFYLKVRQVTLACFHALIKSCEKRTMFGYWSAFLPSTPGQGTNSAIFSTALKDPSAKARTGALAVLTALLEGSKQYLQSAEDSEQYRTAPFTPFSVTLGYMIKEIHRCLMLALSSEQSPLAITQIIKCLATLMSCVPYHRLRPGLLTRALKQIKPFIAHRDPNIRVACLSCLGALVTVQAPLLEVNYLLQAPYSTARTSKNSEGSPAAPLTPRQDTATRGVPSASVLRHAQSQQESDYNSNMSESESGSPATQLAGPLPTGDQPGNSLNVGSGSPEVPTPQLSSGAQTPSWNETLAGAPGGGGMSWVMRLCIKNVSPQLLDKRDDPELPSRIAAESSPARIAARTERSLQPLPVRLESLQVLAAMCRGYFAFLRSHLVLLSEVIRCCLQDQDSSVQLHAAKFLDEVGTVMSNKIKEESPETVDITPQQVVDIWQPLLAGPVPEVLQTCLCGTVRSTLCDALSTIPAPVFDLLPHERQILLMTLSLGLTGDHDAFVRAAAVRMLGMQCALPVLRRDVTFMGDAANVIMTATEEQLPAVKVKAMWALGNLTDALSSIRESDFAASFMEEFSDMLLLKLFEVASKGALDADKVRSNAVRALGNLLRYMPDRCLESSRFNTTTVSTAVKALVKNVTTGAMKVRWNACYALGNMFKNELLSSYEWMESVLTALQTAVRDCKNFKVRINAALSLSVPTCRSTYGSPQMFSKTWCALVECLRNSETTTDPTEYKYCEALTQQMVSTLVHITGLLEKADMSELRQHLSLHEIVLRPYVEKYHLVQNVDLTELTHARTHLASLAQSCEGSPDLPVVERLTSIFKPVQVETQNAMMETPPPTMFTLSYD